MLIDVGWPNGMPELKRNMALYGRSVKEVTHMLMTHYHIDHCGIAQEMKDKGARLVVMENQLGHLNDLKPYLRPPMVFHEIQEEENILLRFSEARAFLEKLGVRGEIVPTPGHSPDHVSLVLDDGTAFTGDLPPESSAEEESGPRKDWELLRSMKVKRIFQRMVPPG